MITKAYAMRIALEVVKESYKEESIGIGIVEDAVSEVELGWIVPYDSVEYIQTRDSFQGMLGNVPVYVRKKDGMANYMHTIGMNKQQWMEEFERR